MGGRLLTLCLAGSLAATSVEGQTATAAPSASSAATSGPAERAAPSKDATTPDERVYLFGGSDQSPPYQYLDAAGVAQGFNPDLIRALARVTGRKIDIRLGRWTDALDEVTSRRVDLVS